MTLDEFVKTYKGKRPDYDGVYGAQCVDLIKLYATKVVGSPALKGNAVDLARNPYPADYGYQWNSPFYIPQPGAIAIWNEKVGEGYGHAAVILEAHLMWFRSLDLNWPKGSAVQEVRHSYKNVKGFLLPKPRANIELYNTLVEELRALAVKYRKM
jgi:mannosyl-glycoprotein endo-beta-N-acetylglucosaminidase